MYAGSVRLTCVRSNEDPSVSGQAEEDLNKVCSGYHDLRETIKPAASYPSFNLCPYPYASPGFLRDPNVDCLDPATYPNFDLWSSLVPAGSLLDDESRPPPKAHEPGQMVHSNHVTATTGVTSQPKPRRSHLDLHLSVFPDGQVITPCGTISDVLPSSRVTEPRQEDFVTGARSLHILTRPLSAPEGRVAGPRSRAGCIRRPTSEVLQAVKKLPTIPGHLPSRGTSPAPPPGVKPRIRKLPPTPSSLRGPPITHRPESTNGGVQGHGDTAGLPLSEPHHSPSPVSAGVARASPFGVLPQPGNYTSDSFERFSPLSEPSPISSPSPQSQSRDSLVLHRMKAYKSRSPCT
jgi:hypothetical protein